MNLLFLAQSLGSLAAMVILVVFLVRVMDERGLAAEKRYAALLNHIQYGERLPTDLENWPVRPERDPDQIGLVGRIDDSEPEA